MPNPQPGQMDELRAKLRMIISHASGGHLCEPGDIERSTNDICVEISRHKNDVWNHAQEAALRTRPTPDGEIGEDDAKWVLRMAAEFHAERLPKDFWPGIAERFDRIATTLETQAADIARLREKKHGGENGTAGDAIDFAVGHCAPREALAFLDDWRSDRATEWPGYVQWLRVQREGAEALATRTDVR